MKNNSLQYHARLLGNSTEMLDKLKSCKVLIESLPKEVFEEYCTAQFFVDLVELIDKIERE